MEIIVPIICFMLGIATHYALNRYKHCHFNNAIHERRYYSCDSSGAESYNRISEYFQAHRKELNLIKMKFHSRYTMCCITTYIDIWYTVNDPEFKINF